MLEAAHAARLPRPTVKSLGLGALWVTCAPLMIAYTSVTVARKVVKKAQNVFQVWTQTHCCQPVCTAPAYPACHHSYQIAQAANTGMLRTPVPFTVTLRS